MNKGKFVFSQVIDFLPRYEFDKIVKVYNGDYRYRHLTSYNHLLHLIFGQLTGCNSLRDISLYLKAHYHFSYPGIGSRLQSHDAVTRRGNHEMPKQHSQYIMQGNHIHQL